MTQPHREQRISKEGERGEGRSSNNIRTAMEGMEVGGEDMNEGEEALVGQDDAEA